MAQQLAQNVIVSRRHRYQTIMGFISQKILNKSNLKVSCLSETLITIFVNIEVSSTKQCRLVRKEYYWTCVLLVA